jgi:hypothetical protein
MKTEDLRLGNYLMQNQELIKVVDIRRKSLRVYNENKNFRNIKFTKISDVQPIELTIKVLEDCEFIIHKPFGDSAGNVNCYKADLIMMRNFTAKWRWVWGYKNDSVISNKEFFIWNTIDYLHELQNLWYAFHKQELAYNQNK